MKYTKRIFYTYKYHRYPDSKHHLHQPFLLGPRMLLCDFIAFWHCFYWNTYFVVYMLFLGLQGYLLCFLQLLWVLQRALKLRIGLFRQYTPYQLFRLIWTKIDLELCFSHRNAKTICCGRRFLITYRKWESFIWRQLFVICVSCLVLVGICCSEICPGSRSGILLCILSSPS